MKIIRCPDHGSELSVKIRIFFRHGSPWRFVYTAVRQMRILIFILACIALYGAHAGAQTPEPRSRWFALDGDSIRIDYCLPTGRVQRPAVIVLSDRYGSAANTQAILKVLARLGFRAYAPPLLSAPEQPFEQIPAAVFDSSDIARVSRVAVEVMSEKGCDGTVKLLGFDIGAAVAAEIVARFPFYKGAALFYPAGGIATIRRLLDAQCALQVHVPQFDAECSLADVNNMREEFMERGRRMQVYFYKEAKRFFFSPRHPDFHKSNTQTAWNTINQFFRSK